MILSKRKNILQEIETRETRQEEGYKINDSRLDLTSSSLPERKRKRERRYDTSKRHFL